MVASKKKSLEQSRGDEPQRHKRINTWRTDQCRDECGSIVFVPAPVELVAVPRKSQPPSTEHLSLPRCTSTIPLLPSRCSRAPFLLGDHTLCDCLFSHPFFPQQVQRQEKWGVLLVSHQCTEPQTFYGTCHHREQAARSPPLPSPKSTNEHVAALLSHHAVHLLVAVHLLCCEGAQSVMAARHRCATFPHPPHTPVDHKPTARNRQLPSPTIWRTSNPRSRTRRAAYSSAVATPVCAASAAAAAAAAHTARVG